MNTLRFAVYRGVCVHCAFITFVYVTLNLTVMIRKQLLC